METRIVIVGYKPKAGKSESLRQLMREHWSILKSQDLVSDRAPIIVEAKDGTIIEVFEWKSKASMEQAHTNPVVLNMWEKYAAACDYIPVGDIEEIKSLFSDFTPFI
jgi:hypothetical protein